MKANFFIPGKRIMMIAREIDMCADCGNHTYLRPCDGVRACMTCGSTSTKRIMENQIDDFRMRLEVAKAIQYAAEASLTLFDYNEIDSTNDTLKGSLRDAGFGDFGPY